MKPVAKTPDSGVRLRVYTRGFKSGPPEQWIYLKMGCGCIIGYPEDSSLPTTCPVHHAEGSK